MKVALLNEEDKKGDKLIIEDTRGQIWVDELEEEQIRKLLKCKIKNNCLVEQTKNKFGVLEKEYFSKEIIACEKPTLEYHPHSIVLIMDGSLDNVPNGKAEGEFYKKIHAMIKSYGI